MTTTITLPDDLAQQLRQQAAVRHRSTEALAIEYIAAALTEASFDPAQVEVSAGDADADLLALVARIKAMPRHLHMVIPATGDLAAVLALMTEGEPDQDVLDALVAAELELRAINRADDIAEGRA